MGPYKRAAGVTDDVRLAPTQPTLGGVLEAIRETFPLAGKKLEPTPGILEPAVRVVLNDEVLQGPTMSQPVRDGDRLAFVPIVGGGAVIGRGSVFRC
jgi:molybdopterin converting factor small subunit